MNMKIKARSFNNQTFVLQILWLPNGNYRLQIEYDSQK